MSYIKLVNGVEVEMTLEEIAERQAEEAAFEAARPQRAMGALRSKRNKLLVESDWTQVADAPVDQTAWASYRQALRDLPANTTDPFNPVWPSKPV